MTSSESPTHPDAPRAGGETPDMIDPDVYRRLDSFATGSPESDQHREDVYALLEAFDALRAPLLDRPAPPIADRELPDTLRGFGRAAKRRGVMSDLNEDARWFAELHAFLDMAAIEIESLRASLLERRRGGERPIGVYLVEYKDGSSVLVKAGQPWPDRWPIP